MINLNATKRLEFCKKEDVKLAIRMLSVLKLLVAMFYEVGSPVELQADLHVLLRPLLCWVILNTVQRNSWGFLCSNRTTWSTVGRVHSVQVEDKKNEEEDARVDLPGLLIFHFEIDTKQTIGQPNIPIINIRSPKLRLPNTIDERYCRLVNSILDERLRIAFFGFNFGLIFASVGFNVRLQNYRMTYFLPRGSLRLCKKNFQFLILNFVSRLRQMKLCQARPRRDLSSATRSAFFILWYNLKLFCYSSYFNRSNSSGEQAKEYKSGLLVLEGKQLSNFLLSCKIISWDEVISSETFEEARYDSIAYFVANLRRAECNFNLTVINDITTEGDKLENITVTPLSRANNSISSDTIRADTLARNALFASLSPASNWQVASVARTVISAFEDEAIGAKRFRETAEGTLDITDDWSDRSISKMAPSLKAGERAKCRFRSSFTLKGGCSRPKGVSCIFKGQFKRRTMALPPHDGTVLCDTSFSYPFPGALLSWTHELVSPGAASKQQPPLPSFSLVQSKRARLNEYSCAEAKSIAVQVEIFCYQEKNYGLYAYNKSVFFSCILPHFAWRENFCDFNTCEYLPKHNICNEEMDLQPKSRSSDTHFWFTLYGGICTFQVANGIERFATIPLIISAVIGNSRFRNIFKNIKFLIQMFLYRNEVDESCFHTIPPNLPKESCAPTSARKSRAKGAFSFALAKPGHDKQQRDKFYDGRHPARSRRHHILLCVFRRSTANPSGERRTNVERAFLEIRNRCYPQEKVSLKFLSPTPPGHVSIEVCPELDSSLGCYIKKLISESKIDTRMNRNKSDAENVMKRDGLFYEMFVTGNVNTNVSILELNYHKTCHGNSKLNFETIVSAVFGIAIEALSVFKITSRIFLETFEFLTIAHFNLIKKIQFSVKVGRVKSNLQKSSTLRMSFFDLVPHNVCLAAFRASYSEKKVLSLSLHSESVTRHEEALNLENVMRHISNTNGDKEDPNALCLNFKNNLVRNMIVRLSTINPKLPNFPQKATLSPHPVYSTTLCRAIRRSRVDIVTENVPKRTPSTSTRKQKKEENKRIGHMDIVDIVIERLKVFEDFVMARITYIRNILWFQDFLKISQMMKLRVSSFLLASPPLLVANGTNIEQVRQYFQQAIYDMCYDRLNATPALVKNLINDEKCKWRQPVIVRPINTIRQRVFRIVFLHKLLIHYVIKYACNFKTFQRQCTFNIFSIDDQVTSILITALSCTLKKKLHDLCTPVRNLSATLISSIKAKFRTNRDAQSNLTREKIHLNLLRADKTVPRSSENGSTDGASTLGHLDLIVLGGKSVERKALNFELDVCELKSQFVDTASDMNLEIIHIMYII
ncbi:hypothetical protein WN51_09848 [Melipona quadrifasciata]|uniref:Uncharacterized protein n=1 Tax=Melipona quadrifasciata TaxID=166423 RepID=A0A0N0U6C6_9HYME|nr:hypothetical protein WN51_09848 [Melipona quadrifasciata]